nr:hypothetical protein [Nocardioides aquaticus]
MRASKVVVVMNVPSVRPSLGGVVAGVVLDQLAERLTQLLRRGPALDPFPLLPGLSVGGAVDVAGGSEAVEELLQHLGLDLGDGEPTVRGAVAVEGQGEPPLLRRLRLSGFETFAVDLLTDLGCDQGQDVRPQLPQLGGIELDGVGDERLLGLVEQLLVEVVGEVLQRVHDHADLVRIHDTGGEGVTDLRPPGLECGGEPDLSGGHVLLRPGGVRSPDAGGGAAGLSADLDLLGVGEDGVLVGSQAGLELGQGHDRVAGGRGVQREQGPLRQRRHRG